MKLKNKIVLLLMCFVLCFGLTSCGRNYNNADEDIKSVFGDYFIKIQEWEDFKFGDFAIVYAKDTKVKYLIWLNTYGSGSSKITPLYNADGSLQVYEEDE
jgi:hypothetical protein